MRTVAIIQARMGSTRLPGKVLRPLAGQPMLARVVERVGRSRRVDETVIATTVATADQALEDLCRERGWFCDRGSEDDVLDRYCQSARRHRADRVVRITSDCPLIDPGLIDEVVAVLVREKADYASNTLEPRTFPRGLDVEVFPFAALERAWREDQNPAWREHVTPFLYRHPERFRLARVANDEDLSRHRWTVDTAEDYELVRRVYDHFGDSAFGWQDVLRLLEDHPDWLRINQGVNQKVVP